MRENKDSFDIQAYMTARVERIVKEALQATFKKRRDPDGRSCRRLCIV